MVAKKQLSGFAKRKEYIQIENETNQLRGSLNKFIVREPDKTSSIDKEEVENSENPNVENTDSVDNHYENKEYKNFNVQSIGVNPLVDIFDVRVWDGLTTSTSNLLVEKEIFSEPGFPVRTVAHPESITGMGGGEGSIRLGSTGKISVLITHELNTIKEKPKKSTSYEKRPQTRPVSVNCGVSTKKQQLRKKTPSRRTTTSGANQITTTNVEMKKLRKSQNINPHQVPMLGLEDIPTDRTPTRDGNTKRRTRIVEIVDLKCGTSTDKVQFRPMTVQFRKLSFSRLSE